LTLTFTLSWQLAIPFRCARRGLSTRSGKAARIAAWQYHWDDARRSGRLQKAGASTSNEQQWEFLDDIAFFSIFAWT
jgi:hypothetical protein